MTDRERWLPLARQALVAHHRDGFDPMSKDEEGQRR